MTNSFDTYFFKALLGRAITLFNKMSITLQYVSTIPAFILDTHEFKHHLAEKEDDNSNVRIVQKLINGVKASARVRTRTFW